MPEPSTWLTDWSDIGDQTKYLVCPINLDPSGQLYLGSPPQILVGWQVKRLMANCYAALELPDPLPALHRLEKK